MTIKLEQKLPVVDVIPVKTGIKDIETKPYLDPRIREDDREILLSVLF